MKTVLISQISTTKGFSFTLSKKDEWLLQIFKTFFSEHKFDPDTIEAKIDLVKTNSNVDLSGYIKFTHLPFCSRCGSALVEQECFQLVTHFAPLSTAKTPHDKNEGTDDDLTKEDTDFCFYTDDIIEIEPILNDAIGLGMRYDYYCPDSKNCQIPATTDPKISVGDTTDARWQALKKIKLDKTQH